MTEFMLVFVLLTVVCPTLGLVRLPDESARQRVCSKRLKIDWVRQKSSLENVRTAEILDLRSRFKTRLR